MSHRWKISHMIKSHDVHRKQSKQIAGVEVFQLSGGQKVNMKKKRHLVKQWSMKT